MPVPGAGGTWATTANKPQTVNVSGMYRSRVGPDHHESSPRRLGGLSVGFCDTVCGSSHVVKSLWHSGHNASTGATIRRETMSHTVQAASPPANMATGLLSLAWAAVTEGAGKRGMESPDGRKPGQRRPRIRELRLDPQGHSVMFHSLRRGVPRPQAYGQG